MKNFNEITNKLNQVPTQSNLKQTPSICTIFPPLNTCNS